MLQPWLTRRSCRLPGLFSAAGLDWLLDSDPTLRWRVLRDLTDAPLQAVSAERARVAMQGWAARLLALRGEDGQWAGGTCFPADFRGDFSKGQPWTATLPSLTLLRDFGIDPEAEPVREVVALVGATCRWEHAGQRFFDGEVEPCINGRTVAVGAYFGVDVDSIVVRLLGEQLADGGWNCEAENGSVRASFATTICVLEGVLEHERATGGSVRAVAARRRGEQYLLDRSLFRRQSTRASALVELPEPSWGTSHVGPGRHEFTCRFRPAEQDPPIPVYDPFAEFADA